MSIPSVEKLLVEQIERSMTTFERKLLADRIERVCRDCLKPTYVANATRHIPRLHTQEKGDDMSLNPDSVLNFDPDSALEGNKFPELHCYSDDYVHIVAKDPADALVIYEETYGPQTPECIPEFHECNPRANLTIVVDVPSPEPKNWKAETRTIKEWMDIRGRCLLAVED